MRFKITLQTINEQREIIPLNYQYSLRLSSTGLYPREMQRMPVFCTKPYGRDFKLFTFSQLNILFKIEGDRMILTSRETSFEVAFHLTQAMESFIEGLFQSEKIGIADKKSKASFRIKSVESLPNPLQRYNENEMGHVQLNPLPPLVAGMHNEKSNYDCLAPDNAQFTESLIYNWRSKIATCYDGTTASSALLMTEIVPMKQPFKSHLIATKAGTSEGTKIRGWMNFGLMVTRERKFVELLINTRAGMDRMRMVK